jgi:hypothetical protein
MHWNEVKFPLQEILPAWPIAAAKAKIKNKFVSPYPTDPVKIGPLKIFYWKFAVILLEMKIEKLLSGCKKFNDNGLSSGVKHLKTPFFRV